MHGDLESLSRRELQLLAKQHGLRANARSEELIAQLKAITSAEPSSKAARLSPGLAAPGSGAKARSPHSSATQRSPGRARGASPARIAPRSPAHAAVAAAPIAPAAPANAAADAPPADELVPIVKSKSLLQSPGFARRRSSAGGALALAADASKPIFSLGVADAAPAPLAGGKEQGEDEENNPNERQKGSAIDSRRLELIRQKVQARKDASRNHRSSRAEERRDKADKVRSIRPTQPKLFAPPSVPKVVSRCPGTHLPIFGAPAAPGAPLPATTPKVVAQAASTPASSWMHHAAATVVGAAHNAASIVAAFGSAAKAGSAQRAPVRALERSPFVALKSEKKLTEPIEFKFSVGVHSHQKSLRAVAAGAGAKPRPKALRIAEKKRKEAEAKAAEKARVREEVRRKVAEHHNEFAAATGIGASRSTAAPSEGRKALAPSSAALNQPPQSEQRSSKTAPPRVGVKQAASTEALRQQKIDNFALGAKARRNAKMMAARAIC